MIRGHSYEVYLADEGVVLINPRDPTQTGPWIRQDATGKWDFDTGMRLRGGGPKTRRELAAQQALRNKRINELNNQEYAFYTKEQQIHDELDEARKKAIETQDNDLSKGLTYLEKNLARQKPAITGRERSSGVCGAIREFQGATRVNERR